MWVCAGLCGSAALSQSVPAKTEDRPKVVLFPEFGITCLGLVFVFTDSRPLFPVCVIKKHAIEGNSFASHMFAFSHRDPSHFFGEAW